MRVSLARIHYLQWVRDPIILTVGGEGLGQERGGGGGGLVCGEGELMVLGEEEGRSQDS